MHCHHRHHELGAQAVHIPHQLSQRHIAQYRQHIAIGDLRRRRIPKHQQDAGDRLEKDKIACEPAQAERRIHTRHIAVEIRRAHVQPEAVSMRRQPRIRPSARAFPAEGFAQILHIQARGQALDRIVDALKHRFLEAFFLDVIEERREGKDGHGYSSSEFTLA